jgi:MFS transporter, PPP family, 3-phenylpropionic acid transporter
VPLRRFYFVFFAAGGVLMPSLALLFDARGFAGLQLGLLTGAIPLTAAVVAPMWGLAADRTRRGTVLLVAAIVIAAVATPVMSTTVRFGVALAAVIVFAIGVAPVLPFLDAATLAESVRVGGNYGGYRRWGGVGWGTAAPIIGIVVGVVGRDAIWIGYVVLMLLLAWLARWVRVPGGGFTGGTRQALGILLRLPGWPTFLVSAALFGIGMGVLSNYLYLRLDVLGASATVMGLSMTVATAAEVVGFTFGDRLVRRVGAVPVLLFGIGAMVLRLVAIGSLGTVSGIMVTQVLHLANFALPWTAAVTFVARSVPDELKATGQTLFALSFAGIAPATGALIGGVLVARIGTGPMFLAVAATLATGLVGVGVAWWRLAAARGGLPAGRGDHGQVHRGAVTPAS